LIGFLLIVSPAYYDRYEQVFRNAGFVISTVLLRVSLSTPKPYDVALALIAMLYGLALARGVRLLRRDRAQGGHSSHGRCCRSSGAEGRIGRIGRQTHGRLPGDDPRAFSMLAPYCRFTARAAQPGGTPMPKPD
jgi:hypothetical protein